MDKENTSHKINQAALDLLLNQGIKKTSLDEIAHRAGMTRITVYRYFSDKKELVAAALLSIPALLEAIQADLQAHPSADIEAILDRIMAGLSQLPSGDLPALMEETQRVYPDLYQTFHQRRVEAIGAIFTHLLRCAEQQGLLRPGLNQAVIQAYFFTSVVHVMENPNLTALGLSADEIFNTVKMIFLYGVLKEK